jgi:hypothetical protein
MKKHYEVYDSEGKWVASFRHSSHAIGFCIVIGVDEKQIKTVNESESDANNLNNG